jgi:predicted restriction endonuclease
VRPLQRATPLVRNVVAPASAAQRAKVAGRRCLACGAVTRIDPAHLVPRSLGGCDEADCVVPLCRVHHRAYDQGGLDLVAHLEPDWRTEVGHAVGHLGLVRAYRRLSGCRSVGEDDER